MARLSKGTVLQRHVGALGHVQDYRSSTDRAHRSIGWWATPSPAVPGCACVFCTAAEAGLDVYLGFDTIDAALEAERAAGTHEQQASQPA